MTLALLGSIGAPEIIIILLIAIVLFGRRLPEVGRSVGKTLFQVRKGINEIKGDFYDQTADIRNEVKATERDLNKMLHEPPKPAPPPEAPKPASEKTEQPEAATESPEPTVDDAGKEAEYSEPPASPDLASEKALADAEAAYEDAEKEKEAEAEAEASDKPETASAEKEVSEDKEKDS